MRLAVIPARGGSKRIPRKNIKNFHGKPIIVWSIEAALASHCFDKVIVSTDDDDIADVARSVGAEVPFVRPDILSGDYVGTIPVVSHAVEWFQKRNEAPAEACCIYATAPFLRAEDIKAGYKLLRESGCEYVFSVTSYAFPIERAIRITAANRVKMLQPQYFNTRSQDLEGAYHDAGQFYWGTADAWTSGKQVFSSDSAPIVLPRHRVQDIDTSEDWERAELMYGTLLGRENTAKS
jgi:pseudaminic acid cytidylyltransferase